MSMEVRCIICDDELLARQNIRAALSGWAGWRIVEEMDNAAKLVDAIERHNPDILFLDIRMPGKTGIDVSKEILPKPNPPEIIFITAFDQYAIQAFELYALDYLLKPFDEQRFAQSIQRAENAISARRDSTARSGTPPSGTRYLKRLFIPSISKIQLVDIDDVHAFVGNGNYVDVITQRGKLLHRATITELENNLDPRVFQRCHRSTIVRIDKIRDLILLGDNKYEIILTNEHRVRMSKTYRNTIVSTLEEK